MGAGEVGYKHNGGLLDAAAADPDLSAALSLRLANRLNRSSRVGFRWFVVGEHTLGSVEIASLVSHLAPRTHQAIYTTTTLFDDARRFAWRYNLHVFRSMGMLTSCHRLHEHWSGTNAPDHVRMTAVIPPQHDARQHQYPRQVVERYQRHIERLEDQSG